LRKNVREFIPDFPESHSDECEYVGKDFDVSLSKVLSDAIAHYKFLAMDKEVLGGTPRIAGTRIPVSMVLDAVQHYGSLEGAIKSYPDLIPDQVREAISFASLVLERSAEDEFTTSFG